MNLALISVEKLLNVSTLVNTHLEVQDRIRDAAMTLWRLPRTAEERYLSSGSRCCWPQYIRDWHAYGYERARMPKIPPQPDDIDRCDEVLDWIAWLASQDEVQAKIVWASFALRTRTNLIASRLGVHRQTVRRKRKEAIQRIVERFCVTPAP